MSGISEETMRVYELETYLLSSAFDITIFPEYYPGSGWATDEAVSIYSDYPHTASLFTILQDPRIAPMREGDSWRGLVVRTIAYLHQHYAELPTQPNLLNEPASSAGWESRYQHQAAKAVVRKGTLMDLNPSPFGWEDYSFFHDNPEVTVTQVTSVIEDDWSEFETTYPAEPEDDTHRHVHGYTATVILSNRMERKMRWEGSLEEIIPGILAGKP